MKSRYSISFVLPMYNEEDALEDSIEELRAVANELTSDYEVIISDDGSTDKSPQIAETLAREDPRVKIIRLKANTKFGGALAAGLMKASKELVVYTDSDLPVSLHDMKKSISMIDDSDIVTAASIIKKGDNLRRKIMSWGYNFLVQTLFKMNIKDINSGYKIYKRNILQGMDLKSLSPFVDVEIFVLAKQKGAKIKEYPLYFRSRKQGTSKISRFPVILQTFIDMFKFKLSLR